MYINDILNDDFLVQKYIEGLCEMTADIIRQFIDGDEPSIIAAKMSISELSVVEQLHSARSFFAQKQAIEDHSGE